MQYNGILEKKRVCCYKQAENEKMEFESLFLKNDN